MDTSSETYIFEEMPIPRAVAKLAVPTVISQVVTMIYNLADTFFIGQLANPAMSAGVSLVSPYFNLLTRAGEPLRPRRREPHLAHARLKGRGRRQIRLILCTLGRNRSNAPLLCPHIHLPGTCSALPGRAGREHCVRGDLPQLGRRPRRRADDGQPLAGQPAAQRGTRARGQRGHDVRRHTQCHPRPHTHIPAAHGRGGRGHSHGLLQTLPAWAFSPWYI